MVSDFGGNEVESDTFEVANKGAVTVGCKQNFETLPSGWLSFGENNSWEWGIPEDGPESAASGEKVYGTHLTADYDNNGDMPLVMQPVDVPEGSTYLQFQSWHENNYDYGHIVVSTDMENWEQLAEYIGTTESWTASEVDLSSYAGQRETYSRWKVCTFRLVNQSGLSLMQIQDLTQLTISECRLPIT